MSIVGKVSWADRAKASREIEKTARAIGAGPQAVFIAHTLYAVQCMIAEGAFNANELGSMTPADMTHLAYQL